MREKRCGDGREERVADLGGVQDGVLQRRHVVVLFGVHARVREHHRPHAVHRESVIATTAAET